MGESQPSWSELLEYLEGTCTSDERTRIASWLAADPRRSDELQWLRTIEERAHSTTDVFSSHEGWDRLTQDWRASRDRTRIPSVLPRRATDREIWQRRTWVKVGWGALAAVVVGVAMLTMGNWIFSTHGAVGEWETKTVAAGQRATLLLSDGTHIALNGGSTIRYARSYGAAGRRDVFLSGEAMFSVVHDPARAFVVHVGDGTVTDVGTQFDVRHYDDDETIRVGVAEGSVSLAIGRHQETLARGDVAIDSGPEIHVTHGGDIASTMGWAQGRLVFDGLPLREVVRDLERTFDVKIAIADSTLANHKVTATFDNETITQILDALTDVVGASYQRNGHVVVIRPATTGTRRHQGALIPPLITAQARGSINQ